LITCTPAFKRALAAAAGTFCTLWKVTQRDGTVVGFTDLDRDIVIGAVTYHANVGYQRTDIATSGALNVDNLEAQGPLAAPSLTDPDLTAGIWDFAAIQLSLVNWADFFIPIPITSITRSGTTATATVASTKALATGDTLVIGGADQSAYNVSAVITVTNPTHFTYTVAGSPATPATGTLFYNTSMGALIYRVGNLGEATVERANFKAELRGLTQAYTRVIGELTAPSCRTTLGSPLCKVDFNPPVWTAATSYAQLNGDAALGGLVKPTVPNGRWFYASVAGTSGGSEPAWNTAVGGTTVDGGVTWTTILPLAVTGTLTGVGTDNRTLYDTGRTEPGPSGGATISAITRANPGHVTLSTPLPVGTVSGAPVTISGVLGMTNVNVVTIANNVAGNLLSFDLPVDTTNFPAYTSGGTVTPLGSGSGFFDNGVITFTSGNNAGNAPLNQMEVQSYVPGQLTLELPMPYACQIGDTYTLNAGCDYSFSTCQTRFINWINFRGEPYVPGLDKLMQVGKQ